MVDLGRFELPFPQCECGVLPLDHRPVFHMKLLHAEGNHDVSGIDIACRIFAPDKIIIVAPSN